MTLELDDVVRAAIAGHAASQAPRECCGLIVRTERDAQLRYYAGTNLYSGTAGEDRFELDPAAWVYCEEFGDVVAVVHSHPSASANPSMADRVGCERSGLPWVIMGWPSEVIKIVEPSGWSAPYKGRTFHHGVLDCYTLVQDWYQRELGIALPDVDREDEWWRKGQDLYVQHFAAAGFVPVNGPLQRHDVVLMQVMSDVANHAAIYQGDDVILHHLAARLSCDDVYGGYWARHTLMVGRHASLAAAA